MADPIVIQCPTCSKKFKFAEGKTPPAVFTCTGCQTPMDLSAFRPAEPAAVEKAPRTSKSGLAGRSATKAAGRGAAARMRRSRAAAHDDGDGDEEGGRHVPPPKDNSQKLIIGSLIGLVVIGGISLMVMNKKKHEREDREIAEAKAAAEVKAAKEKAEREAANPLPASGTKPAGTAPATGPGGATSTDPAAPGGDAAMSGGTTPSAPVGKGTFHEVGHHPDATPDEQKRIDELVNKAIFENAGSDSREAGNQLVALGVKAAPRLINVFNTIKNGEGYGDRMGKMKAGIADALLRRIDGYQERLRRNKSPIKATSEDKFAEGTAKAWFLWWDTGTWKEKPQKPWDPRVDGAEAEDKEGK